MPFFTIEGTFHVEGYSPDGSSVRFKADGVYLNVDRGGRLLGTEFLSLEEPRRDYRLREPEAGAARTHRRCRGLRGGPQQTVHRDAAVQGAARLRGLMGAGGPGCQRGAGER